MDDFESYTDTEGSRIYRDLDRRRDRQQDRLPGRLPAVAVCRADDRSTAASSRCRWTTTTPRSPFYSEAERTFSPVQNWTVNGADTLTLWFRGNPMDFLQRADGSIQMSGGGTDIWDTSDQFRFAYKQLNGDGTIVAKIDSLANTSVWAKAGVMIRGSSGPGVHVRVHDRHSRRSAGLPESRDRRRQRQVSP